MRRWRSLRPGTRFTRTGYTRWKRQPAEGMVDIFSGKKVGRDASHEAEIKDLHAKIGQLTVERDFLSKAFGR